MFLLNYRTDNINFEYTVNMRRSYVSSPLDPPPAVKLWDLFTIYSFLDTTNGRQARGFKKISHIFGIRIKYIRGLRNNMADFLGNFKF